MNISRIVVERPIMTSMFIIVFLIFGGLSYFNLSLDQMPDVEIPYVTIVTVYPGAGPKEVESQITDKIEDAVATVSNIKSLSSYSLENISIVTVEFKIGENIHTKNLEVKDKVDGILNILPKDIDKPVIQKVDLQALPTVDLVLSGSGETSPIELFDEADNVIKNKLAQIEGVANVNIVGGAEREIQLLLDNRIVFENQISLSTLAQIIAASNINLPAGHFNLNGQQYNVRMQGEFDSLSEIDNIEIPTAFGIKKFGQLGYVADDAKKVKTKTIFFNNETDVRNENVVLLSVIKSPDGNTVKVADGIYKILPHLQKELPAGYNLTISQDRSEFIRSMVDDTISNIVLGVILTAFVLLLFIGELRSTFIVALAMPISIVSTFWLLDLSNFSLNMMTLMGISSSVGVLVSNSIVVIENIFRHKDLGLGKKDSAAVGTQEVALAVLASTLTNLVVFVPLATMNSMMGQYLSYFAWTVVYATIFSLIVSFTVTPMLSGILLPIKFKRSKFNEILHKIIYKFERFYRRMLIIVLHNKRNAIITIGVSIFLLVGVLLYSSNFLAFELFPQQDQGYLDISVELPEGYELNETGKVVYEIEHRISKYPEVATVTSTLGQMDQTNIATSLAKLTVKLVDSKLRSRRVEEMISLFIREVSDIPNAKISIKATSSGGMSGGMQFYLMGDNLDTLEKYKNITIEKIKDVPGLVNFDNSSRQGAPEITVKPDRDKIAEAGLTVAEVAMGLRGSIEGIIANSYRESGNEYDINITMNDISYNTPEKIGNISISNNRGNVFRLSQLCNIDFNKGFTKILHKEQFSNITFTGDPAQGYVLGQITSAIEKRLETIHLPEGYKYDWGGDAEMMAESMSEMLIALILAIVLTYMLLAALLEHLVQPLIILSTLPLAMIGVLLSLIITGKSLSVVALLAIIMLIGIIVNNAILILDYSNQLIKEKNISHKRALIEAAPIKLRPILMSTLAIMLGMLPMAMGWGDKGAEMRQPLGIVQVGGLTASTILCLFIVPALDYLSDEFYHFVLKLFKRKSKEEREQEYQKELERVRHEIEEHKKNELEEED